MFVVPVRLCPVVVELQSVMVQCHVDDGVDVFLGKYDKASADEPYEKNDFLKLRTLEKGLRSHAFI